MNIFFFFRYIEYLDLKVILIIFGTSTFKLENHLIKKSTHPEPLTHDYLDRIAQTAPILTKYLSEILVTAPLAVQTYQPIKC